MKPIIKEGDKLIRERSLMRAGHRCELCTTTRDELDTHHMLPKTVYPQHRYKLENTAMLCRLKCHNMAENHPDQFADEIARTGRLTDRLQWANDNEGIDKYPIDVDDEENVRLLKEAV